MNRREFGKSMVAAAVLPIESLTAGVDVQAHNVLVSVRGADLMIDIVASIRAGIQRAEEIAELDRLARGR